MNGLVKWTATNVTGSKQNFKEVHLSENVVLFLQKLSEVRKIRTGERTRKICIHNYNIVTVKSTYNIGALEYSLHSILLTNHSYCRR